MPAQKRPAPLLSGEPLAAAAPDEPEEHQQQSAEGKLPPPPSQNPLPPSPQKHDDSDASGGRASSPAATDSDEYILVKLSDIRKEVQCPICLGIIRKTRTVMECLHRFCRECIDKSMRLGNNECPACRTHCKSRRSLRDDANYDALISALYPNIDKYEEEELAFHEEERRQNRKIQASIAETFRRQSKALGRKRSSAKATAAAFVRRSQRNFRRGRGRSGSRDTVVTGSDDVEEEVDMNAKNAGKDTSSLEEFSPEGSQKRCRREPARSSPAKKAGISDIVRDENDNLETSKETVGTRAHNREILSWGKGGARSQMRHGNASSSNGRFSKCGGRTAKLMDYLGKQNENGVEFDVHLTLLPLNERSTPCLEEPYLCCPPTVSIRHLCQFIADQKSVLAEEVKIFVRVAQGEALPTGSADKGQTGLSEEIHISRLEESLGDLQDFYADNEGGLVLLYQLEQEKKGKMW